MMDCKRALTDADGDAAKAVELLRERGLAKAVKRSGRETSEGTVAMSIDGGIAGIVELGCETDFVAKTDDFQALATACAAAAAANPSASSVDELLEVEVSGEKLGETIQGAVSRLGENIVLKRAGRVAVGAAGCSGGYVHAGGKLGVVVALETAAECTSRPLTRSRSRSTVTVWPRT
jgi:elongation factor Ts